MYIHGLLFQWASTNKKSTSACWSSTKRTSSSSHWKLTCSRHDVAELALNNNQSINQSTSIVNIVKVNVIDIRNGISVNKCIFKKMSYCFDDSIFYLINWNNTKKIQPKTIIMNILTYNVVFGNVLLIVV